VQAVLLGERLEQVVLPGIDAKPVELCLHHRARALEHGGESPWQGLGLLHAEATLPGAPDFPRVDPFAVLGVTPGTSAADIAAAYRAAAKRWHPDVAGADEVAATRMAELNAAYDAIRTGDATAAPESPAGARDRSRPPAGAWLPEETRRLLGRELLAALAPQEPVRLVTDTATWTSPRARLVLSDRRLLWLHDDAIIHRVRSLRLADVRRAEQRLQWPRRRRATVRVTTTAGRRLEFADLEPGVAERLVAALRVGATR